MKAEELEAQLERLHPESFGWALHCCNRDRTEAEDVLQTAYLKILSGKARFGGRAAFRTWLFGVIRVTARERRRRGSARDGVVLPFVPREMEDAGPDPLEVLEETERAERLAAALMRLSERQREILHLVFYQDLTVAESAGVMGISLGSARTHYERGKARLRTLLSMREDDDATGT